MRFPTYSGVDEVEVEGAKFQLCPVPTAQWLELGAMAAKARRDALRRALLALKAAGEEATEDRVDDESALDPLYLRAREEHQRTAVAWGVRGHSGLPFEFKAAERAFLGGVHAGASDETVTAYADGRLDDGSRLLSHLYVLVSRKNALGGVEKKSSPPPSATDGASTAPTV